MLEHHINSPVTRQRLCSGPAADHIDGFADWLHRLGYKPVTIDATLRSLAGWTDWMRSAGFTVHDCSRAFASCATELQTHAVCDSAAAPTTFVGCRCAVHPVSPGTGGAAAACHAAVSSRSLAGHRRVSFMDAPAPWTDRDDPGRLSGNHRGASRCPRQRPTPLHGGGPARLRAGASASSRDLRVPRPLLSRFVLSCDFSAPRDSVRQECSTPSPASPPGSSQRFLGSWLRRMWSG